MATAKGASDVVACPSIASTMKAYSLPLILFSGAIFFQLYVLPNTFPLSHYDVLAVKRYSSIEEVREAYHKVSSKNSGSEVPSTLNWLKIQYAYELLTNPTWKKNYDIFGVEEQIHVLQKAKEQYSDQRISSIELPLLDSPTEPTDTGDQNLNRITLKDFQSMFQDGKPWLIQLYSFGSKQCAHFSDVWKTIAALLDGVANTALVELGEIELVAHLAEKKPTGQPFFRNGLPSIIAFPLGCKTANCLVRYNGELSVDAITDWFSTTILDLPRIFYYPKESLRTKTPELVSEDAEPVWLKGVQNIASTSMIMPRIHGIRTGLFDLMGDPRIGPVLLLSALMSFGTIWLQRSQPSRRPDEILRF